MNLAVRMTFIALAATAATVGSATVATATSTSAHSTRVLMEYRASGLTEGRASMPGELHLSHGIFQQKPPKKQKNCDYNSNLGETAQSFMSRCVKGSAKAEFPSQYLNSTLAEIKSKASSDDDAKKAKKLLTDGRFRK